MRRVRKVLGLASVPCFLRPARGGRRPGGRPPPLPNLAPIAAGDFAPTPMKTAVDFDVLPDGCGGPFVNSTRGQDAGGNDAIWGIAS